MLALLSIFGFVRLTTAFISQNQQFSPNSYGTGPSPSYATAPVPAATLSQQSSGGYGYYGGGGHHHHRCHHNRRYGRGCCPQPMACPPPIVPPPLLPPPTGPCPMSCLPQFSPPMLPCLPPLNPCPLPLPQLSLPCPPPMPMLCPPPRSICPPPPTLCPPRPMCPPPAGPLLPPPSGPCVPPGLQLPLNPPQIAQPQYGLYPPQASQMTFVQQQSPYAIAPPPIPIPAGSRIPYQVVPAGIDYRSYLAQQISPQIIPPRYPRIPNDLSVPIPAKEKYSTTTWEKVPPDPFEDNSKNGSVSNSNPFQPVNNNGQQPIVIPAIVKPSLQTGTTGINPALLAVAQSNSQAQGQSAGGYQIQPPFAIPSAAGAGTGQSSPSLIAVPGGIPVGGFPPNWSVETAQVAAGQGVNYQIPSQGGYQVAPNGGAYQYVPIPAPSQSVPSAVSPECAPQAPLQQLPQQLNNGCYRCPRRTKKAKALASKTQQQEDQKPSEKVNNESQNSTNSIKEDDSSISTNRQQCTSTELKSILKKNSMLKIEQAKELIHQQAEEAIGGMFHVFCSEAAIEYLTRTNLFCIGDVQDGVCYIMKT